MTLLFPACEGTLAVTGEKSARTARLSEAKLQYFPGGFRVRPCPYPVLRGVARFWQDVCFIFRAACTGGGRVRPTRVESLIGQALRIRPESLAAGVSLVEVLLVSLLCLVAVPRLAESVMPGIAGGLVRAFLMLLCFFALSRVRFLRRYAMYRGAIAKVVNARGDGKELPEYIACVLSSRCSSRTEEPFVVLVCLLSAFFMALPGDWYAGCFIAIARVALVSLIAGIVGEITRFRPVKAVLSFLSGAVSIEPGMEMIETVLVAIQKAEERPEKAGDDPDDDRRVDAAGPREAGGGDVGLPGRPADSAACDGTRPDAHPFQRRGVAGEDARLP